MVKVPGTTRDIWILGAEAFIGRWLIKSLSVDTANTLHLLVHKNVPSWLPDTIHAVKGSYLRFNLSWFDRYPPEVVFLVESPGGRGPLGRKLNAWRSEKAYDRLLNCFRSLDHPPVIVMISGSLIPGPRDYSTLADENAPSIQVNPKKSGLRIIRVRPAWVVGPGSWFKVFFWDFYLKTGRVPLYGDGSQRLPLIHVEDFGKLISKIPETGEELLDLFAGDPVTQGEFTRKLAEILQTTRVHIPLDEVRKKFGKAEAEALGASSSLTPGNAPAWKTWTFKFPRPEDMIIRTIEQLKAQQ